MNEAAVRTIAQSDPVPNLTAHWGQAVEDARTRLDLFVSAIRRLDAIQDDLVSHGVVVNVDLGPIGNAAAAARRDLERTTTATFELPR